MTIDISDSGMAAYETVLATLLVCDWGIRAWTLLEAIRGRKGLFVLCCYNRCVNLHELLKMVHNDGRMDLINLFVARDYLLPPAVTSDLEIFGLLIRNEEDKALEDGFVNIGTAAALLSHRHATRDGDDLLIWSLLLGDIEDENPIAMWKRQVGNSIPTGTLVSSAQRIQGHPGLGWTPFTPTAVQRASGQRTNSKVYPAHDGHETFNGLITKEGLRAKWLTYVFPVVLMASSVDQQTMQGCGPPKPIVDLAEQYLHEYERGALLQSMPSRGPRTVPVGYRGSLGWLLVVCGSHDEITWEWKGFYEWDASIALPPFSIREIVII